MNKKELKELIIAAFSRVYETLGYGFEKEIYENAFMMELDTRNISHCHKMPVNVYYDGVSVGKCIPDFLIGYDTIILISTMKKMSEEEIRKLENYCDTTCCDRGFVLNFGAEPEVKVMENDLETETVFCENQADEIYSEQVVLF